jgi:lathosterol oxidase
MAAGTYSPYRKVNQWINDNFFDMIGFQGVSKMIFEKLGPDRGYYATSYVRDFIVGSFVYWLTAGIWHAVIYWILGDKLFHKKGREMPSTETLVDQMALAQSSLVLYAALPIFSEMLIENKLTQVYFFIDEVGGWGPYFMYLFIYVCLFEVGIYWVHRTLHTNKFLYKYVHALHHKYNKHSTLSPWASLAFNPLDGALQV